MSRVQLPNYGRETHDGSSSGIITTRAWKPSQLRSSSHSTRRRASNQCHHMLFASRFSHSFWADTEHAGWCNGQENGKDGAMEEAVTRFARSLFRHQLASRVIDCSLSSSHAHTVTLASRGSMRRLSICRGIFWYVREPQSILCSFSSSLRSTRKFRYQATSQSQRQTSQPKFSAFKKAFRVWTCPLVLEQKQAESPIRILSSLIG